jgi:AraC-like DNA-binding protein
MTTLILFGAINFGLFGLFSLFRYNKANKFHLYFAITLLAIGSIMIRVAYFRGWNDYSWISMLPILSFAVAPSFYLYVLGLTSQKISRAILHLVPVTLHVIYQLTLKTFMVSYPSLMPSHLFQNTIGITLGILLVAQLLFYIVKTRLVIQANISHIKQHYSNLEGKQLKWVKVLFICMIMLIVLWIGTQLISWFFEIPVKSIPLVFIALWLLSYYLFGISLLQNKIEAGEDLNLNNNETLVDDYKKLWKELNTNMETHQYYLDETLSLQKLAKILDTPQRILSRCINQQANMNFHAFVNSFRVNQVKKEMEDHKNSHLTLLGMAYKAGFKSKSSFNQVFKNTTGFTPKEYLHNQV